MSDNLPSLPTPEEQIETSVTWIKARSKRERLFFERPELMEIIESYIADGGSLITLSKRWHIRYGRIMQWINKDKERQKRWEACQLARKEWAIEAILNELRGIAHGDITRIFTNDGRVKPVSEWPEGMGQMIESIEVKELASRDGEQLFGEVKKIKFHNKMRALELLGKAQSMFLEQVEHRFQPITLSDLVNASWEGSAAKDVTPKTDDSEGKQSQP